MTDSMPTTGSTATISHDVSDADIAQTLGTGDVPVLASSRLLTWAEQATCAAVDADLDDASTSVGIGLRIEHLQPSPLGTTVSVRAELVQVDGRQLVFQVQAEHDDGEVVGRGEVTRMVLDRQRFLQGADATD
ncbi:MAG: thioesterase family protein [Nocardioidaceae bacterium]